MGAVASLGSIPLFSWMAKPAEIATPTSILACAAGDSPANNVQRAISSLGGIEKFVHKGSKVLLKAQQHESLCRDVRRQHQSGSSGGGRQGCVVWQELLRFGAITHDEARAWEENGIGAGAEANHVEYRSANSRWSYQSIKYPKVYCCGKPGILKELLEADVFINIPVAKQKPGCKNYRRIEKYHGP